MIWLMKTAGEDTHLFIWAYAFYKFVDLYVWSYEVSSKIVERPKRSWVSSWAGYKKRKRIPPVYKLWVARNWDARLQVGIFKCTPVSVIKIWSPFKTACTLSGWCFFECLIVLNRQAWLLSLDNSASCFPWKSAFHKIQCVGFCLVWLSRCKVWLTKRNIT